MQQFLSALITCTVTMTVPALLLLVLSGPIRKKCSARSHYIAWVIVLCGFLIPINMPSAPRAVTLPPPQSWTRAVTLRAEALAPVQNDTAPQIGEAITPTPQTSAHATKALPHLTGAQLIFIFWALGALGMLGYRLYRHLHFARATRRWREPIQDATALAVFANLREQLHITRKVELYFCPVVDSPMLAGIIRPCILLPTRDLCHEALRMVLHHELMHLRHGDLWGRLLLMLVWCAHWFNPVMFSVARQLTHASEAACDAAVIRDMSLTDRKTYGQTILHSMRTGPAVATALSTRFHGGKVSMQKRLRALFDLRKKRLGTALLSIILICVLGAGMAFAIDPASQKNPFAISSNPQTRVQQLNLRLAVLLTQPLTGQSGHILPDDFNEKTFDMATVNEADYAYYMEWMDKIETVLEANDFLSQPFIDSPQPPEAVQALVTQALTQAGYIDHGEPTYAYRHFASYESGMPTDEHYWNIQVPLNGRKTDLLIQDDSALIAFNVYASDLSDMSRGEPLSEAEKETVRARAKAYAEEFLWLGDDSLTHTLVSDYQFLQYGGGTTYTYAWVYSEGYDIAKDYQKTYVYNNTNHEQNEGYILAIELESGRILQILNNRFETEFVNNTHAQTDWANKTGLEFPYPDSIYMWDVAAPQIGEKLRALTRTYADSLTDAQLQYAVIIGGSPEQHFYGGMDWKGFEASLDSVSSAEDYISLLESDILSLNQTTAQEPSREEIMLTAQTTLDIMGYGGFPLQCFTYNSGIAGGPNTATESRLYTITLNESAPESYVSSTAFAEVAIDAQGKVAYAHSPYLMLDVRKSLPAGEEAKAREKLLNVFPYLRGDTLDKESLLISTYGLHKESEEGKHVTVEGVFFGKTTYGEGDNPLLYQDAVSVLLDIDTGFVYEVMQVSPDYVQEHMARYE